MAKPLSNPPPPVWGVAGQISGSASAIQSIPRTPQSSVGVSNFKLRQVALKAYLEVVVEISKSRMANTAEDGFFNGTKTVIDDPQTPQVPEGIKKVLGVGELYYPQVFKFASGVEALAFEQTLRGYDDLVILHVARKVANFKGTGTTKTDGRYEVVAVDIRESEVSWTAATMHETEVIALEVERLRELHGSSDLNNEHYEALRKMQEEEDARRAALKGTAKFSDRMAWDPSAWPGQQPGDKRTAREMMHEHWHMIHGDKKINNEGVVAETSMDVWEILTSE